MKEKYLFSSLTNRLSMLITIQIVRNTMASIIVSKTKNFLKCPIYENVYRCINHGHHCLSLALKSMKAVHGTRHIVADYGLLRPQNRSNRMSSNTSKNSIDDITTTIQLNSLHNIHLAVCWDVFLFR